MQNYAFKAEHANRERPASHNTTKLDQTCTPQESQHNEWVFKLALDVNKHKHLLFKLPGKQKHDTLFCDCHPPRGTPRNVGCDACR